MLYDYILTVDSEILTIWTLPWRLPKFLFLINRYIVPLMLIDVPDFALSRFDGIYMDFYNTPSEICKFVARFTSWPTFLSVATVEMILIIRTSAIYNNSKAIKSGLYGVFFASMTSWIIVSAIEAARTTGTSGETFFTGCIFVAHDPVWPAWVIGGAAGIPTLQVLARDSIAYFFIMFLIDPELIISSIIAGKCVYFSLRSRFLRSSFASVSISVSI
ncbi:hypothetical protein GYMLUDRAFT_88940 [Collybiopsis luxurians FD-317 M1]|uniref:DUF6533 domain-containing protein n=1 Tax=Collybiopsis luxurians FD-317 M1 TaxID=944289 RepID=A0A0D0BBD4_9AGAR|nr:hypothetical protein GYMLUDRAFT_88940 [Collybiopsis luxurians FD-317 M1]